MTTTRSLRWIPWLALLLPACAAPDAAVSDDAFDLVFTGRVLRVEIRRSVDCTPEGCTIAPTFRVLREGVWPGRRTHLEDDSNLGALRVVLRDRHGRIIYSEGFSTLFGEWRTTAEAKGTGHFEFEESLRIPEPAQRAILTVEERDAKLQFGPHAAGYPDSIAIDTPSLENAPPLFAEDDVRALTDLGPVDRRVDVVFVAEGYTEAEREKFFADAQRLCGAFWKEEPYASRRGEFNVRARFAASAESGVGDRTKGIAKDTALGCAFGTFGSERYVLAEQDHRWRELAAAVPYDFAVLVLNARKYGGGGIYGLYCTAAADSAQADYLLVHEFGHHFAGLADEYYTSPVAYEDFAPHSVEPWDPNVTALLDPGRCKWADLLSPGVALPTPWPKEDFESVSRGFQARRAELTKVGADPSELERLFAEEKAETSRIMQSLVGTTGAFEGAMYEAKGLYRPAIDCLMFSRNDVGFCPVCRRAISAQIDRCIH